MTIMFEMMYFDSSRVSYSRWPAKRDRRVTFELTRFWPSCSKWCVTMMCFTPSDVVWRWSAECCRRMTFEFAHFWLPCSKWCVLTQVWCHMNVDWRNAVAEWFLKYRSRRDEIHPAPPLPNPLHLIITYLHYLFAKRIRWVTFELTCFWPSCSK